MLYKIFFILSGVFLALPFIAWVVVRFIDKKAPILKPHFKTICIICGCSCIGIAITFAALAVVYFK
ncbi:MAG: hypothetical protein LBJ97_01610 [Mycoplasmataceae bacterium]|nr:hypothetical protein [Mycoplasmataceae bacterium]